MSAKPLRLTVALLLVVCFLATTAWSWQVMRGFRPLLLPLDEFRRDQARIRAELDSLAADLEARGVIVSREKYAHVVTLTQDWRCSKSSLASIRHLELVSVAYAGHYVVIKIADGVDDEMISQLQVPGNTYRIVVASDAITDVGIARLQEIAPHGCVVLTRRESE
jgi:hypothetical protein